MDRRFVLFIVLTLLLWTGFLGVQFYFAPPPEPVAAQPDEPPAVDPADKAAGDPAESDKAAPPAAGQDDLATATAPQTPRKRVQLGSLDPASPYRMRVYFDSQGAAVERVELNAYYDVEDRGGYLGHLSLSENSSGGATVNVVSDHTPAALAKAEDASAGVGLKVGDVIVEVAAGTEKQAVTSQAALDAFLGRHTLPTTPLKVTVERGGQPLVFTAVLTRRPLEVVRPESHTYATPDGGLRVEPIDPLSLLLTLDIVGTKPMKSNAGEIVGLPSLQVSNWELDEAGENVVQFSYQLDAAALKKIGKSGSLKLVKRYELAPAEKPADKGYHLKLRIEIHNQGDAEETLAYRLQGPTGAPLEGWWYSTKLHTKMFYGAGARDVAWRVDLPSKGHELLGGPKIVSEAKAHLAELKPVGTPMLLGDKSLPLKYAAVDTQFFAAAILPQPLGEKGQILFRSAEAIPVQDVLAIPKNQLRTTNVSVLLVSDATKVAAGETLSHDYHVFFGPKDPQVLEKYELEPLIEYGWPIFKWPAVLLQWVLAFLYSVTQNYGIAIILLTMLVRSCMIPVSLKQARSAAMMQQLAPEIQKIKEKIPDDAVKQHAAVQELYKRYNFNPFGGCLLVFIQLPIFIGLYRCLSVDIDLRDASLVPGWAWASNLAGPDKLFYWKDFTWDIISDEASGWLGPYFNFLPLITVTLFLIQQKMFTPPATDEQTRMQQQMMTYMTVFMGVMFYKVPAGLCLYFITSSLWGICERKLLPKIKPRGDAEAAVAATTKATTVNGSAKTTAAKRKQRR